MRGNRYDDDSVVNEYYENYRRAGAMLWLAVGGLIAWVSTFFLPNDASQITGALSSLARTVLGWGCVTAFALSLLQYVYAFLFPRLAAIRL